MSKKDDIISFDNFQKGIGPSPHLGFADMRNIDILSSPGEALIEFKTQALTTPPTVSALAYTTNTATDTITVSSTSGWFNGMAITLDTVVTSTGISTGRVYWVGDLTATTFKLYTNPSLPSARLVDITGSNGSGTLSSYTFAQPLDGAVWNTATGSVNRAQVFILDTNGRAWWVKNDANGLTNYLVYLGNDTLTSSGNGRAIVVHSQDIVVFRSGTFDTLNCSDLENDAIDFDGVGGWSYSVDTVSSSYAEPRPTYVGQNKVLYFDNSNRVGSLADDYTKTSSALDLPNDENVTAIGELGRNLLIGTQTGKLFPWDKTSSSFDEALFLPEPNVAKIITANNTAFVFAGNTGSIYATNGSAFQLYKKLPDYPSGVSRPYYTWKAALPWRGQLYFSTTAEQNDGTDLSSVNGVWAIDLSSGALRQVQKVSSDSYAGSVPVILPHVLSSTPPGHGLYLAWANGSTYGVDVTASTYYTDDAYLETELTPVGTALAKRTFRQLHILLGTKLASGEGIKVSYRKSLSDSYTTIGTYTYATEGAVSSISKDAQIVDADFIQLKAELISGGSTTPKLRSLILI